MMDLAKVAASAESMGHIRKFGTPAGGVNVTEGCELIPGFAASGLRC